ncbi:HEAT repeat-containing protein [Desulfonispora thiosulfatigenes DSM 11270]|uniref:HEAT repeat-containing protein n=1 Tax=Desulfonispora thiosulfatigenes DSM 11270 TaxID=656914 RepID=A0A1W1V314_DESTI|nr:HEAT repeat domain-containing protein [Desulfonispora thiosulfatigenes]SMB87676.1 HEAT repeat-containing protein [Desulfonispora thiosulfatigenes DSM 11270]
MSIANKLKNIFVFKNPSKSRGIDYNEKENITQDFYVLKKALNENNNLLEVNWDNLKEEQQKQMVMEVYLENWRDLIYKYNQYDEKEKIKIIEMLAYIPHKEVVDFLINEMKSTSETIRLSASCSLRKQDTSLTLEPMLYALTQPNQWLPSRVLDVLKGMGSSLIDPLLEMIKNCDPQVQSVLVQILGEIGDKRCLGVFTELAKSTDDTLRLRIVEALKVLALKESFFILTNLAQDDKWQIRMHAVEALGNLELDEVEKVLRQRLKVEDDSIVLEYIQEFIEKINQDSMPEIISWVREG